MNPGDNMKSSEDFLWVVLHEHIVAAAEIIHATSDSSNLTPMELSEAMIKKFVQIIVPSPSTTQRAQVNNNLFVCNRGLNTWFDKTNFMTPSGREMERFFRIVR